MPRKVSDDWQARAAARVREAIVKAEADGIPVARWTGDGVLPDGHGGWKRDVDRLIPCISPIGAVLLAFQPDSDDLDIPCWAASAALEAPVPWVDGLGDGIEGRRRRLWDTTKRGRDAYGQGFETGRAIWKEICLRCDECGHERSRWEAVCAPCADGLMPKRAMA